MSEKKHGKVVASSSIGFGAVLAIVMSWTANHAVIWAIIHGVLGWIYVVYYLFTKPGWTYF